MFEYYWSDRGCWVHVKVCGLTTELLHEAHVAMGVEGKRVGCYTQGVKERRRADALQGRHTLHAHRPHLLLTETTVPQGEDICQRHVLLGYKHTHTQYLYMSWSCIKTPTHTPTTPYVMLQCQMATCSNCVMESLKSYLKDCMVNV